MRKNNLCFNWWVLFKLTNKNSISLRVRIPAGAILFQAIMPTVARVCKTFTADVVVVVVAVAGRRRRRWRHCEIPREASFLLRFLSAPTFLTRAQTSTRAYADKKRGTDAHNLFDWNRSTNTNFHYLLQSNDQQPTANNHHFHATLTPPSIETFCMD